MAGLFIGNSGLRHQFYSLAYTAVVSATNAGNAVMLCNFRMDARMCFLDSTLNQDVALLLVAPDSDPATTANRLFWIELPSNRVINYDTSHSPSLSFDAGTKIFVYGLAVPTSGKLRIAAWG